jgi:hypothetical protein
MPTTRPRLVQIFGERCSGTNFVAELLRRNLPGLLPTDHYGWKHGYADRVVDDAPECLFVVVHRDVFDWVRSLQQKPWHAGAPLRDRPLGEFVREPWWCEWGRDMPMAEDDPRFGTEMLHERDRATGERFANVLQLRAAKQRDWAALAERVRHAVSVRYEDVAAEPKRFVREVARRFGLRRWPWFRAIRTHKGGPRPFVATRYEPIEPADVDWIAAQVDADLERRAGYDIDARRAELVPISRR